MAEEADEREGTKGMPSTPVQAVQGTNDFAKSSQRESDGA